MQVGGVGTTYVPAWWLGTLAQTSPLSTNEGVLTWSSGLAEVRKAKCARATRRNRGLKVAMLYIMSFFPLTMPKRGLGPSYNVIQTIDSDTRAPQPPSHHRDCAFEAL